MFKAGCGWKEPIPAFAVASEVDEVGGSRGGESRKYSTRSIINEHYGRRPSQLGFSAPWGHMLSLAHCLSNLKLLQPPLNNSSGTYSTQLALVPGSELAVIMATAGFLEV